MKKHRFFIDQKVTDYKEVVFTVREGIHKIRDVLRLTVGDSIILLDGTGREFYGKIKSLSKEEMTVNEISMKENQVKFKRNITLASALLKKDKYEWVLQKGTEIGVNSFLPIITERTEKINLNMERVNKIVREASEQSGRGDLPKVYSPISFKYFLDDNKKIIMCFTQNGSKFESEMIKDVEDVIIMVGPEGGFTEDELEMLKKSNAKFISLGDQVFRAETAAIISSAVLQIL